MILGKSFDDNSKSSYIDRRNSLNNKYDISDQFEDNKRNQLSKENDVNFNRKSFLTRFIHKKRVKDYDSAQDSSAFEDINEAYESNDQPKRLSNNYLNSNHSLKNKNKGFLLRKITTVEYIIRNDNEAINFLDEKTKENLLSLLKNLKADNTSFFNNTKFSTEIVDIGHDRGTFKDGKNDLLKTLSEFKENKSRKPQEGLLSAENNPYDHQNAADKQKLPLNNKYILGNFDELPNNLNKNLNDVDNEYEKKLSGGVQIIPETAHKDNKKKFRYNNDYYLHNNDKILSNIPKNSNKHINGYDKDLDEDVQSFPEKSDVADKQKFHFTNDYYPGNTKELPSNTNKNSNEHHYESGKILPEDVQGVPETDDNENSRYNYDNYPGNNDRLPSKINKNPNNDIIKYQDESPEDVQSVQQIKFTKENPPSKVKEIFVPESKKSEFVTTKNSSYKANKEDDYPKDETSTHMKYQSRKPSLKAYLVTTQTISDYSSTTSYESARQGAVITSVETTPRNKLNEMSTKNVADHTVQDEASTKFNLLLLEIPETVTFSPDVDEEPSVFESEDSYIKKYPIVLPPKLPNTSETNLTKVLMHIRPPHRTIAPEIRYKRKQKVRRRRRSKRSPITSKHSMLRRLQIDAEEDVKKDRSRETENVPQRDCCHNGGKCYASHHPSQGDIPFLWCLCPPAFQGRFCEEDVNECSSLPCKPHERCIDEYGGFRCNCKDGFVREGDDCIRKTDV
ncbi:hypothetical protein JTE90_001068 [Oedothorax gibbosus]|uniref:EGF-like domain-containing protein n=1 Tax=Oedothorax gibbosus TaxID=931172 RepID=A0AAV6TMP6_9ARAC|nr:hypothetical protein JTE90_001068 [Oedothorax gibbosus]